MTNELPQGLRELYAMVILFICQWEKHHGRPDAPIDVMRDFDAMIGQPKESDSQLITSDNLDPDEIAERILKRK